MNSEPTATNLTSVLPQDDAELLSALIDDECSREEVRRATLLWARQPEARATWHTYALMGDALRSEELAADPSRDARFLQSLRERLAAEPAIVAPMPLDARPGAVSTGPLGRAWSARRSAWARGAAVGAFGVAMLGAGVALRLPQGGDSTGAQVAGVSPAAAPASTAEGTGGVMERNAELDRYLAAHRQFAQGPAFAAPGGVRQVALSPQGQ
jgi:sigma-E factor negative regulatory protein RseA